MLHLRVWIFSFTQQRQWALKKNQVVRTWGVQFVELATLAWWKEADWVWWKVVMTVTGVRTRASAEVCGSRVKRISEGSLSDF